MLNLLPSMFVLGLAALIALLLVQARLSLPGMVAERGAAARALAIAVVVQAAHFAEETASGLPQRLPALFDLPPIPFSLFVAFNLVWLGIWIASVPALKSRLPAAFFAAWFLAVAGIVNGIVHPLLAAVARDYFPGLVSSPVMGVVSAWLWVRLHRATVPRATPTDAASRPTT